jgi:hypothetical protein
LDDLARLLTATEQGQVIAALNILIERAGQLERVPLTVSPVEP